MCESVRMGDYSIAVLFVFGSLFLARLITFILYVCFVGSVIDLPLSFLLICCLINGDDLWLSYVIKCWCFS